MDDWTAYDGDYGKREYDVRLTTGEVIQNCWPNAGLFTPVLDTAGYSIPGEMISAIRPSDPTSLQIIRRAS